ncbi:uncharacterized protein LOC110854600 isoform X2 [Folsomia candida]|uniref:uncharacterized protein LOC110854600 isoform X2 n=1 Tax=Folsomia candida TaxID=158441 RepID=UPI0016051BD0|nr:uncharacterized protein LOC110854600 isoform X2 [Folsomia candida]
MSKTLHFLLIILHLPFWLLAPFLILAFIPIYLARNGVKLLAFVFRHDLISMLAPVDGMFAADQIYTGPKNTVVGCLHLEGIADSAHIRDMLDRNILEARCERDPGKLMYPELRRSITHWLGYPFWTETELPHGGIRTHEDALSLEELHKFQTQLTFQPFRKNAPLWELVLIKRITDTPNTSAVLFRFHHALADGLAIFSLLRKMTSPQNPKIRKQVVPARGRCKGFKALRILSAPYDIAKLEKELGQGGWLIKDKEGWTQLDGNSHYSTVAARLRFHSSESIPFSVGGAHGVSVTAVLHSAMLGAVRKSYFPSEAESISRVRVQTQLLPMWGRGGRLLGNNITCGSYSAHMGELDVVKRLIETHESLVAMKRSACPVGLAVFILALGCLSRPGIRNYFQGRDQEDKIFVFNIPGPEEVDNFCGYNIKHIDMTVGSYAANAGTLTTCRLSPEYPLCFLESTRTPDEGSIHISVGSD